MIWGSVRKGFSLMQVGSVSPLPFASLPCRLCVQVQNGRKCVWLLSNCYNSSQCLLICTITPDGSSAPSCWEQSCEYNPEQPKASARASAPVPPSVVPLSLKVINLKKKEYKVYQLDGLREVTSLERLWEYIHDRVGKNVVRHKLALKLDIMRAIQGWAFQGMICFRRHCARLLWKASICGVIVTEDRKLHRTEAETVDAIANELTRSMVISTPNAMQIVGGSDRLQKHASLIFTTDYTTHRVV